MGVDLAKHRDYTVISVFDTTTNAQVYQDRFQTIEWPFQKKKIKTDCEHFNRAMIALDSTGVGDPIADDLIRAGLPVQPIVITEQTKKDLIEKLSIYIEHKRIKILPLSESLYEYDNFSYEIGPTGRIRYGAAVGFNDDIVIAHALAVWSMSPLTKGVMTIEKTPIQKDYAKAKSEYQNNQELGEEFSKDFDDWGGI